jgi:hypothetical protein
MKRLQATSALREQFLFRAAPFDSVNQITGGSHPPAHAMENDSGLRGEGFPTSNYSCY